MDKRLRTSLIVILGVFLVGGRKYRKIITGLYNCLKQLKSALNDPADPGSYRAIAGSSIILKLFDKVVLLLWGHLLCTDTLQFVYKVGTSTTQCSWLVQEVANYYLRMGTYPLITLLDCSKAFNTCQFSTLFTILLER